MAAQSHAAAIDQIENIIAVEGIACDFQRVDGFLFDPNNDADRELHTELAAARRAGLTDIEMVERAPLAPFNTGACLRFPNQAQFHPLKYLYKMASAFERRGGRIFGNTHAKQVQDGAPAMVTTDVGHTVTAASVVVATNTPINDVVKIHTKQAPYRTYVIGLRIPRDSVPRALYWDTLDPYHYVRVQPEEAYDVLIVGGEDHKTGQDDDKVNRFERLERWTRERFSTAEDVVYSWSGQVMEPVDGLAFIGKNPGDQSVYIATGDSGHGMTHGTLAGILLTDMIQKQPNPWAALYDPARITLGSLGTFAEENINVAAQYTSFLTPGEVSSMQEIATGTGAVIREGLTKIAVYRDTDGVTHRLNAKCPHLGCIVAWNPTEKTWDCPCHGSRFAATGTVINGPAISDLSAA